jgi:hypothetical protein
MDARGAMSVSKRGMRSEQAYLAFQGLHPAYHSVDGRQCFLTTQRPSPGSVDKISRRILERSKILLDVPLGCTEDPTVVFIGNLNRGV